MRSNSLAAGFLDARAVLGSIVVRSVFEGQLGTGSAFRPISMESSHRSRSTGKAAACLGGIGRIDRHGSADDYKWSAEGRSMIEHVLATTSPWLGVEKNEEATTALAKFSAQPRLKGDATHCVRGHSYSGFAMKGGRRRRICNACER